MTDPQWARVLALYESACGLAPDAAQSLLESSLEDPAVVREVRVMLEAEWLAEPHSSAAQDEYAGVTIGRYEVISRIGSGSSGEVYSGRDRELARRVALKFMSPEYAGLGSAAQRFIREAQAASALNHPNIVTVHEVVTWQGSPVIVMELVEGAALRSLCGEPLPLAQALTIGRQIMEALAFAHGIGIVHRDLKPENVMVRPDGYVKLLDLGLARRTMTEGGRPNISSSAGLPVGTLRYMSPEQCRGETATPASDVFAAGIVLSEMIAGHHPFNAQTPLDTAHAISWSDAPALGDRVPGVPQWLEHVVARMLEKDAAARPSAAEVVRILAGERGHRPGIAPWAGYRARKLAAKFKYRMAAAAVLILLAAAIYLVASLELRQQKRSHADTAALRDVVRRIIIEGPAQLAKTPNRTGLRSQLIKDAESALDALSRDATNDVGLQMELARAYLSIGLAKGPYSATGSEGDPAGAAPYVRKSMDVYSRLVKRKPADIEVRKGQLEALSTWVHLQYRLSQLDEGQKAARQMQAEVDGMTPELREKTDANWYLSIAYTELGLILVSAERTPEALAVHRKAAALIGQHIPAEWLKDPDRLDHLARVRRELAISAWMAEGYTPEVESAARQAVEVVSACGDPNCRMRHAQVEGTLGEIEWASGKPDQGIATLRRSVDQFESLEREDPQNAVLRNAGAQTRSYLALTLAGGPHSAEAVDLAERSVSQMGGAPDAQLHRGRERLMVHQITLGAALLGARRLDEAASELRGTLESNRDWNANEDLIWSALHVLAGTLERQGKYEEEASTAKEELKSSMQEQMYTDRLRMALAARDYAAAVAHWKDAGPNDRAEALRELDNSKGLDDRYGVIAGALLIYPPKAKELASLRKELESPAAAARF